MRSIKKNVKKKVLPRAAYGLCAAMVVLSEATWEKCVRCFLQGTTMKLQSSFKPSAVTTCPSWKEKPYGLERVRFAALKLREGSMETACGGKACQC